MKHLNKHLKPIAYLLVSLILLQSCVVYKTKPSTLEQASDSKHIKIETLDGNKYKVRWIEEKDGNIVTIKNTKRISIDKSRITQIIKFDPVKTKITLELALKYKGEIQVKVNQDSLKYKIYNFIKIEERDELLVGYKMTGKDTSTIVIPIEQIKKIQLENKGLTITGNIIGSFVGLYAAVFVVGGILYIVTPKGF